MNALTLLFILFCYYFRVPDDVLLNFLRIRPHSFRDNLQIAGACGQPAAQARAYLQSVDTYMNDSLQGHQYQVCVIKRDVFHAHAH